MCDAFFSPKFLNVRGILAQEIYNAHTIFRQFSDFKYGRGAGGGGGNPNNKASSVGWLPVNPNITKPELAILRNANLIFQCLSNPTLFSIVFFACGVHKLN